MKIEKSDFSQSSIRKLRKSRSPTPPNDSPSKLFFHNVGPNAKQRAVLRLKDKKEVLPRGSSEQIRRKFGINLPGQSDAVVNDRY